MDFRQLEIFVAIIEAGSFSRAGERLYMSQPTVTAHMNSLERELEQQLLIRSNKGVRLTESGKYLYEYARNALEQREDILLKLSKKQSGLTQLRIAASSVPAQCLLPELLSSFHQQHNGLRINMSFCDSMEVSQKLTSQQADLGFSGYCAFDVECEYLPIAQDRLVVITPKDGSYASLPYAQPFPIELLLSAPMVVRESGSGTRREFVNYLQKHCPGRNPNIVAVLEDYLAIKNAVSAGMGISVMSGRSVEDYVRLGYVRAFPLGEDAVRNLYILRRKKSRLMGIAKEFFQFALEEFSRDGTKEQHTQLP
ncbi:MAG: selenium metabolism-associated LysR family transcriptional regulator [Bacillota bacterium]|nr:selenium metabolism-associated LysR family transcriptional regulator [Bacillota bacterium]